MSKQPPFSFPGRRKNCSHETLRNTQRRREGNPEPEGLGCISYGPWLLEAVLLLERGVASQDVAAGEELYRIPVIIYPTWTEILSNMQRRPWITSLVAI